jgi:gliding motility-associated-like protein
VKVFDRSGRVVYQKSSYNNDWKGMINGSPLATGTYYYIFIVDGGKKIFKGYIEILHP